MKQDNAPLKIKNHPVNNRQKIHNPTSIILVINFQNCNMLVMIQGTELGNGMKCACVHNAHMTKSLKCLNSQTKIQFRMQ